MPELPEVETISRALKGNILNKVISKIKILTELSLREKIPQNIQNLSDIKIINVKRQAKYIEIFLDNFDVILIHLGMSGKILFNQEALKKHDHLLIEFTDGSKLTYNDPRRFGLIALIPKSQLASSKYIKNLGIEPLSSEFTSEYLAKLLNHKNQAIKLTLMDNSKIVGIGNIYASECLFLSKILPYRASKSLNPNEIISLHKAIITILTEAIEKGGSTLKDYASIDGNQGYFQNHFKVYAREGKDCLVCSNSLIVKTSQAARTSFYCPNCQK